MMKRLLSLLLVLAPGCAFAQTVTITGTVKDPNGIPYQNGSGRAILTPTNVNFTTGLTNPVPGSQSPVIVNGLDGNGHFTVTLTSTAAIDQQTSNPQWLFSFCSASYPVQGPICFSGPTLALTSSQDITAQISAVPPPVLPGAGGGAGANPAPPNNVVQKNVAGTFAASTAIDDATGYHWKGPNPWIDITQYGARSCNQAVAPCAAGITASTASGSNQVSLSSPSTFVNGDGVVVFGAGAANAVTTPTGLSVTNVLASAGTGTGQVVTGAAGTTTRCYKIIARDTGGGYTTASSEVCNTTGQTSLGLVTVNISSCTRAQTLVTCTTSAATPLLINNIPTNVGGEVYIGGSPSDSSFRGWREVAAVADSTHFTFVDSIVNTTNGAATSETGGTASFFVANHLTWTPVTNAWLYYIYEGSSGAETLVGVSRPQGISAGVVDATFDDFGPVMMANYVFPAWIPTTPPTLAANDNLSTTITAGAGTTTLTLAASAGATVSAGIRLDAGPAFVAAAVVANQGGPLFVPMSANPFVINNYCDLSPYQISVVQSGQLYLHETISLHGAGLRWVGDRVTGVGPQSGASGGGWGAFPQIVVAEAVPGMYVNSGGFSVDGISFQPGVTNGILQMVADWASSFNAALIDTGFAPGTSTANLMGFGLIFRGANGLVWDRGGWGTGNSGDTSSHNAGFYCSGCGDVTLRKMFTTGRGMIFNGSPAGTGALRIEEVHYNGGGTPLVSTLGTAQIALGQPGAQIQIDTVGHSCVAVFGGQATIYDNACSPSGFTFSMPSVTGVAQFAAVSATVPLPPSSGTSGNSGVSLTTQLRPTVSSVNSVQSMNFNLAGPGGISVGLGDSIWANGIIPAPPTCSVSAGGSLPVGSYVFGVQPVYWNGLEGTPSNASSTCTTTPGNQTITVNWTTIPVGNPVGYNIYTGGAAGGGTCGACTNPFPPSVTQLVWSSGLAGSPAQNIVPLGGPSVFLPQAKGIAAPEYTLSNITGSATGITSENSAYDNFNRANGAIGSNWTVKVGGVNVASNVAVGTTSANAVAWNQANFSSFAQFARVTLVTLNGTTDLNGPMVFSQIGANSDYECVENTTTVTIQQVLNGSASTIATAPSGGSPGDILLLTATVNPSGTQPTTTLTCFRNGTQVLTGTSTTFTSGAAGFRLNGSVATVDNWSGGNLHSVAQLDTEQDWTKQQHFLSGFTLGTANGNGTGGAQLNLTAAQGSDSNVLTSGTVTGTGTTLCTDANGGATTSGCLTSVAVQSQVTATLGADNTLTASTATSIITQAVTMPSSGCPCRAFLSYGAYHVTPASDTKTNFWVDDNNGTDGAGHVFATSQTATGTSPATTGGNSASAFTTSTYANNASVTFVLRAESNQGITVKAATFNSVGQNTWLQIVIQTSN